MAYDPEFFNGFRCETGTLLVEAPHRKEGKKAFNWTFTAKGAAQSVPVEVHLVQTDESLMFKATCALLPAALVDTDINRLHGAVEAALLDQVTSLTGIEWQDWFEVVVGGANSDFSESAYSALGASLHVQVNRLKRGVHPKSGAVLTINVNGVVVPFPRATSLGRDVHAEGAGIRLGDREKERSYIPATPANRRALDELLGRMAALRASVASLLSQGVVQERLSTLSDALSPLISGPIAGLETEGGVDDGER
jgi:hypothetical protein